MAERYASVALYIASVALTCRGITIIITRFITWPTLGASPSALSRVTSHAES